MTDSQGMTVAERTLAEWIAGTLGHAMQALPSEGGKTQYGPNTIAMAKSGIAHLQRRGFAVHLTNSEAHDHCDHDPGECSYQALVGEHAEAKRRLGRVSGILAKLAGDMQEAARGLRADLR